MNIKFLLFIVIILILLCACAILGQETGFYTEELLITRASAAGQADTTVIKMWIMDKKFRRIQGDESQVTIGRLDKGLFWIIDLNDSTYSEIDLEIMRRLGQMTMLMMGVPMNDEGEIYVPQDLYVRTGEKKTIEGWKAEEVILNSKYAGTGFADGFTMWISQDVQIPTKLYADNLRNLFGDPNGEAKKLIDMFAGFKGYPVRIESKVMGMENIIITTRIEEFNPPGDYFKLPSGLTEVANPLLDMMEPEFEE